MTLAGGAAAETADRSPAEALFRRALAREGLEARERVRLLEKVAKEHPGSKWADDAVWVLGEAARQQNRIGCVLRYWQYLMGRWPEARLEEYTRSHRIFRDSEMPVIEAILRVQGVGYLRREEARVDNTRGSLHLFRNADRFNCLPMTVWTELGKCYEQLERPRLALLCYRRGLDASAAAGSLRKRCERDVERLEKYVDGIPPLRPVSEARGTADDALAGAISPARSVPPDGNSESGSHGRD